MTSLIEIRRATAADLDAITAIEQRCFAGDADAFSRRQLLYLICKAQGVCYIACHGGSPVGYISLLRRRTGRSLRIYSIAVVPQARGEGAGQALLDAAAAAARGWKLSALTLEVRTDNTPALGLYVKNGFKPDALLRGYYHDGADARQMVLRIE